MAKIINFFGSPGAAKSTNSAMLFSLMKRHGVKCELVTEYAKDVVYRGDIHTLSDCQPLIFGKQHHRVVRAAKHVDYIVTDSPLALSAVYGKELPVSFKAGCLSIFKSFDNLNFFLKLDPGRYKTYGRNQTVEQSLEIEKEILSLLDKNAIWFTMVRDAEEVFAKLLDTEFKFYGKTCTHVNKYGHKCNQPQTMNPGGIGLCKEHGLEHLSYLADIRF